MTVGKASLTEVAGGPARANGLVWPGFAIALAAVNLRPSITSTAPVLPEIQEVLGLGGAGVAALSTIPVVGLAVGGPLSIRVARRLGIRGGMTLGLVLISVGLAVRPWHPVILLVGTALAGLGIAFVGVLLPAFIADARGGSSGRLSAVQMVFLTVGAAAGSGLSYPVVGMLAHDVRVALVMWAAPALAALVVWARGKRLVTGTVLLSTARGVARTRLSWVVTGYFGTQALLFFTFVAWLPSVLRAEGIAAGTAGGLVSVMSLAGLPAAWAVPQLADRMAHQRLLAILAAIISLVGLFGLILGAGSVLIASVALVGFGQSACFSLALSLIVLRAADPATAAALSGFAQSVGFLIGAVGPWVFGFVASYWAGSTAALGILVPVVILEGCLGWAAGAGVLRIGPNGSLTDR